MTLPGRGVLVFGLLGIVTCALTWPIAVSLDQSFYTHSDYFSNLWNIWWVRKSVLELGTSPYWTDALFFPTGISLATHTLSLANSLPGALLSQLVRPGGAGGEVVAFNILTLVHFWLSAWVLYLLAYYLTGNRQGSILAGIIYSFCPFHYYYLPMINIVSMESLPLAMLFLMKTYREGGTRNIVAAAMATALTALSCWYYLPYIALLALGLIACGRLWAPEIPFLSGLKRIAIGGIAGGILVLPLALPLISATLFPEAEHPKVGRHLHEGHDLLGFMWIGPPEKRILAWPSAVGYSGLLLVALGFREVRRHKTWLIFAAATWLLGLGGSLTVGGSDTGIPLPYAALVKLPVLSMLRNPDRMFLLLQLSFAVLCAYGWVGVARRFAPRRAQQLAWAAFLGFTILEFNGSPLRQFPYACSAYLAQIAADPHVASVIDVPASTGPYAARYNRCQTIHGKKIPLGYVTNLAMTSELVRQTTAWNHSVAHRDITPDAFFRKLKQTGIDLVILNKRVSAPRRPEERETFIWKPFAWAADWLLPARQTGAFVYRKADDSRRRAWLEARLGAPVHEDALIVVYRAPRVP